MTQTKFFNNQDNYIPLGGIGTGFLSLSENGAVQKLCLDEKGNDTFLNNAFFVLKAKGAGKEYSVLLQGCENSSVNIPYVENINISNAFPFTKISYLFKNFPSDISCSAYSPFMPINSVDSGIPCAVFDFSVKNTSDCDLEYSFYFAVSHNFEMHECSAGCSESGEAHILMSDTYNNNLCIATNEKFVSFATGLKSFHDFKSESLESASKNHIDSGKMNIICASFKLGAGKEKNLSFFFGWYFPECCANGIRFKNYYTKYFESSSECAEYYFTHKERLFTQSSVFCQNILSSGVLPDALIDINESLFDLRKCHYKRTQNGELICLKSGVEKFTDIDSFLNRPSALYTLFASLDYSFTNFLYKTASDEYGKIDFSLVCPIKNTDFSDDDCIYLMLLCILKSYRYYLHTADLTEIIENWYCISRCMDYFFCEEIENPPDKNACGIIEQSDFQHLYSAALFCAGKLAKAVNDKKRVEVYEKLFENSRLYQDRLDFTAGFALLNDASGFSYDAVSKHISFCPKSENYNFNLGEYFRCFFCTPSCYGYVEEGVDYLEINILYGKLNLRSVKVPRTPRLVQYGGRNWNFKGDNCTVVLDSELEISTSKKLTILMDIK